MKGRKPNQPRSAAPKAEAAPVAASAPAAVPATAAPVAAEAKVEAKPAEAKTAESAAAGEIEDDRTKRGLAAIERREAQFRSEQTRIKEEHERREARIAQRENELEGKTTSIAQLKGLRPGQLIGELKKLGMGPADFDAISRVAWSQTETGSKDPKAQDAARDAEAHYAARSSQDELAQLKAELAELKGEFGKRDQLAAQREYAEKWRDGVFKSIPGDKPTLLAKLVDKNPDRARAVIIALGAEMEKANGGEAPAHADVIAEFEKRQRIALEESGVDVDAILAPKTATTPTTPPAKTAAVKPSGRTLDVSQPANGTRPREPKAKPMTHQERVAHARELRDQTPR